MPNPNCSDPSITISSLIQNDPNGGVLPWFDGRRICLTVNARAAIRKACELLNLRAGDEVLAPAYNCGSEIDPLLDSGVDVVLYRIKSNTDVDVTDLLNQVTGKTRAIYVTHYFGLPQRDISRLQDFCKNRSIYLIEDCALALFSELNGQKLGTFGDVSIFCFYKYFPTIGGGALMINNPDLAMDIRMNKPAPNSFVLRSLAHAVLNAILGPAAKSSLGKFRRRVSGGLQLMSRRSKAETLATEPEVLPDIPDHYYFNQVFRNASISRLTERTLRSFPVEASVQSRRKNYTTYLSLLGNHSKIKCLFDDLPAGACPLIFPVLTDKRDAICTSLNELRISATPWWKGYHKNLDWSGLPETHHLKDNLLALPLHQYMDDQKVRFVCEQVIRLVEMPEHQLCAKTNAG